MKNLIIAGGNGFLGQTLIDFYKNKVEKVYVLSRSSRTSVGNVEYLQWDGKTLGDWAHYLSQCDVLINLSGKSVDCRYHQKNKDLILSSRIDSTRVLGQAINQCENPPKIWLNSSTATIYRHSLDKEMDERNGELGDGFSVGIAKAWEKEFFSFELKSTRQVALRTSIVFGKNGGAFIPIKNLTKIGFGGKQGSGLQKVSWIHEEDFARSVDFIIQNKNLNGPINIVSPKPTTNGALMKLLRTKMNIPFGIPMGKSMLELGARIIKTETELILKSRNVIPGILTENGFQFKFGTLDKTIDHLIKK